MEIAEEAGLEEESVDALDQVAPALLADGHAARLLSDMQTCLADHFDVAHSTLQFEPASHAAHEHDTHP